MVKSFVKVASLAEPSTDYKWVACGPNWYLPENTRTGAVGPGLLLVHDNAQNADVARLCRQSG